MKITRDNLSGAMSTIFQGIINNNKNNVIKLIIQIFN